MSHIVLTEEQARVLADAVKPVEVRDAQGKWFGCLDPVEAEIIAEYKRRGKYNGPVFTSAQVRARLDALQKEWDRLGGFDREYAQKLLAQLNEQDPGHMRTEVPSE